MKENYFYIKHSHKHGTDFYVFKTRRTHDDIPSLKKLCEIFLIDYDFNYDDITEFIDWDNLEIINLDKELKSQ
jgi:hypothetical protein